MNIIQQKKYFQLWNIFLYILLLFLIIIGGFTRLTGSGLSITQWELFKGIFPPFSEIQWKAYFSQYKNIPQFKLINYDMNIEEFKFIFWWEYLHRLVARILGLSYLIPLIYFIHKKFINKSNLFFYFFLLFLICFQGFAGWFMVSSGLSENTNVSHFRLAFHLSLAVIIISLFFWSYLNSDTQNLSLNFNNCTILLLVFLFLIFFQIIYGAFTSGLEAGLIYQSWPKMNLNFVAEEISFNSFFSLDSLTDMAHVQFIHRINAYLIFISYSIFYSYYFRNLKKYLFYMNLAFVFIVFQIFLGILTLITGLNIYLAALHQFTSIMLISSIILLIYKLKS